MQLRDRQKTFVGRCVDALRSRGNTLAIAPTGFGKTVAIGAVVRDAATYPALVIQHRDELVTQNRSTFSKVARGIRTDLFTAERKRFVRDGATFGMVQTLARNLDAIPELGLIVIDEAHHTAANSYLKVIEAAKRRNPKVMVAGVTATPGRGDNRNLRATFDNVADQVTINELIDTGFLVRPRCFVIDIGVRDELRSVRKTVDDFDMNAVAAIMDKAVLTDRVIEHWKEAAGGRRTVVFASTVAHAQHVAQAFREAGVRAEAVYGDMGDAERRAALKRVDTGETQVVVNAFLLTEGWDCQPMSCCILLRPTSYKSTFIQMVGRVLRKVDPERYPGVLKDDAIVMDFGTSILTHGDLTQKINLQSQAAPKDCPECASTVPSSVHECPICGYCWPQADADYTPRERAEADNDDLPLSDFVMTEVDLFAKSPYRYETLFDGLVEMANGLDAWACCVNFKGRWVAIGGSRDTGMKVLADNADRLLSLTAADDYLREHGDDDVARKTRSWMRLPPTEKQMQHLNLAPMAAIGISRYRASAMMTWKFSERGIRQKLMALQ